MNIYFLILNQNPITKIEDSRRLRFYVVHIPLLQLPSEHNSIIGSTVPIKLTNYTTSLINKYRLNSITKLS